MAFLLPEAFLGLAEVAGTGAAEVTGSELVGQAVQAGVIQQEVDAAKSAAKQSIDAVLGEGTYDKLASEVSSVVTEAGKVSNTLGSFDDPYTGLKVHKDHSEIPTINLSSCNPVEPPSQTGHAPSGLELLSLKGIAQGANSTNMSRSNDAIRSPPQIGSDLGKLLSLSASGIVSKKNQGQQIDLWGNLAEQVQNYPSLAYLLPKIVDYSSLIQQPSNETYRKIYSVYNGSGLSPDKVIEAFKPNGDRYFYSYDETGVYYEWIVNKTGLKIPTINGFWTGPNSRNDEKPINLLDTYSFFHDIDWNREGNFHLVSDYKLISRIVQNLGRMSDQERVLAKGAVNYFSTVGAGISGYLNGAETDNKVFNGAGPRPAGPVDSTPTNDITSFLGITDKQDQHEFYKAMGNSVIDETSRSSIFANAPISVNSEVSNLILNMSIQLE